SDSRRLEPRELEGRDEAGRGRRRSRGQGSLRASERRQGPPRRQPGHPARPRRRQGRLLPRDARDGEGPVAGRGRKGAEATDLQQGLVMGLHDRLKGGNGNGTGASLADTTSARTEPLAAGATPERVGADPYAELKTRVHHACIAKLGPELFT